MKKVLLIVVALSSFQLHAQAPASASASEYWQQELHYNIKASLNVEEKLVMGSETITYKNNSPETLRFIWFHLWPNAYKNDSTALLKQIRNDPSRKTKLAQFTYGSIDGLNFKVNGNTATTEPHSNASYIDIIKLKLDVPLKPGDSIDISTDFTTHLPSYFSRSGFADGQFMICQWYPKPAVYDKAGWHEMPYLDMGEFYSDYGSYAVELTVPSEYVVAATGVLQTSAELQAYKTLGKKNVSKRNNKPTLYKPSSGEATKKLVYSIAHVPDFAWFADKNLVIEYDTAVLSSGKIVDAFTYYHNIKKSVWKNSIDYVKDAVRAYSRWLGDYEYPVVQAIEGPKNNSSGGMEYPTITLITSPDAKKETLDAVIAHEVGHNWFMSMLGSNEREHTWMDEGLNSYFQFRYEAEKYRSNSIFGDALPQDVRKLPIDAFQLSLYNAIANIPMESAIETPAAKFTTPEEYGLISYVKTALWVYMLEAATSREQIDNAFRTYFAEWKDKHPQPSDLKVSFEESLHANLDGYFLLLDKQGKLE